jgi:hypothetical protein
MINKKNCFCHYKKQQPEQKIKKQFREYFHDAKVIITGLGFDMSIHQNKSYACLIKIKQPRIFAGPLLFF